MTLQKASGVSLMIGDGGSPVESFTAVGGLRAFSIAIDRSVVFFADAASGPWRKGASEAGISAISIQGAGAFADTAAEEALRAAAFSGIARNFELHFANGDTITAPFILRRYQRSAQREGEEEFSVSLESAGVVTYASA